jgi:hypothetical protein
LAMPQPDDLWYLLQREAVQKDLAISSLVASKLEDLSADGRVAEQRAYQEAGINPQDFPSAMTAEQRQKYREIGEKNKNEFLPKRKELLTAEQIKRFGQIQLQYLLSLNGPGALLTPNVASELKLTDDQKQKLDTLGREFIQSLPPGPGGRGKALTPALKQRDEYTTKAIDVLTAEQKETLNKLRGNELDVSKLDNVRPPGTSAAPPAQHIDARSVLQQFGDVLPGQYRTDIIVDLATNQGIRGELNISDELASKLTLLRDEYRATVQKKYKEAGVNPADFGPFTMTVEQRQLYRDIPLKLNEEFIPKVKELLTSGQYKRLQQIQFQHSWTESAPDALLRPHEAAELKLTDEQKDKLKALSSEFNGLVVISGRGSLERQTKHSGEYEDKALGVLTEVQRDALVELKGDPFNLSRLVPRTLRIAPPVKGN